jgi:hypothetical protein
MFHLAVYKKQIGERNALYYQGVGTKKAILPGEETQGESLLKLCRDFERAGHGLWAELNVLHLFNTITL